MLGFFTFKYLFKMIDNKIFSNTKLVKGFIKYKSKINWLVFILISLVSLGGWIDIFGNKMSIFEHIETFSKKINVYHKEFGLSYH